MQLHLESPGDIKADFAETSPKVHVINAPRVPGEIGIWIFILGDMLAFAVLFCLYLRDRSPAAALFNSSQEALSVPYGVFNTLLLLTASLCVVFGVNAMRNRTCGRIAIKTKVSLKNRATVLMAAAIGCGLLFCAVKVVEYGEKITAGIVPTTNSFWLYYYILTGFHLFHLILGLGVLVFCLMHSQRDHLSSQRFQLIEGAGCFWHMVDLLWIVLFPLLYLVK